MRNLSKIKQTRKNYRQTNFSKNKHGKSKTSSSNFASQKTQSNSQKHLGTIANNIPKMNNGLTYIKKLEIDVLQSIIGQDSQIRQIITSIYRNKIFNSIKSNILIIGKSGTGKTASIIEIAKKMHVPYTIEDATKYTQEGYKGADVQDMLLNLYDNANRDLRKAQNGILIIDEIDKKTGQNSFNERDVSGSEVLKSLLKIIEGSVVKLNIGNSVCEEIINFNTRNITVIFLGAFSGLDKIRKKRLNTTPLGFSSTDKTIVDKQSLKFTKQDLVSYGMTEEFVGRIDTIIEMNDLSIDDLISILKNSQLSIFRKYKTELSKLGISLEYDEKLFSLIAEKSLSLDTGARELNNTVNHIFENISYDIFSTMKNYTKCKLSLDIVKDNTKYELS